MIIKCFEANIINKNLFYLLQSMIIQTFVTID